MELTIWRSEQKQKDEGVYKRTQEVTVMKEKTPPYKFELLEELPDGTLKYRVVKTKCMVSKDEIPPEVHERPRRGLRKSRFKNTSLRIEEYLSKTDRAQTTKEIAEGLGVTPPTIYDTLKLMEVFGTIQKVKRGERGGKHYYLLKSVYDEEENLPTSPPEKTKPNEEPKVD